MQRAIAVALAVLIGGMAQADDTVLKNWFNDPFFQLSDALPQCPVPLGPLLAEAEMRGEAHSRVERGTSCWMAGTCKEPNAYLYDAGIAQAVRERMTHNAALAGSSIWITVKRRFVWAEGCVSDAAQAASLEAVLKTVPDVERVLVNVMQGTEGKPPYARLSDRQAK